MAAPTGNTYDSVIFQQSIAGAKRPALPAANAQVRIAIPNLGADVIGAV